MGDGPTYLLKWSLAMYVIFKEANIHQGGDCYVMTHVYEQLKMRRGWNDEERSKGKHSARLQQEDERRCARA